MQTFNGNNVGMSPQIEKNIRNVGERLKAYRKEKGLTVVEMAKILGISHGSLSGLENNKSKPSFETIANLCRNTDADLKWMLTGRENKEISHQKTPLFKELEEWALEISGSGNLEWLENQIENQFPDFKRWREERSGAITTEADCRQYKVA